MTSLDECELAKDDQKANHATSSRYTIQIKTSIDICYFSTAPCPLKSRSGRMYLDPDLKIHARFIKEVKTVVKFMQERYQHFIHGYNTCFAESLHNKRCKFTNKRIAYTYFEVILYKYS
jgi:hypothetical protein